MKFKIPEDFWAKLIFSLLAGAVVVGLALGILGLLLLSIMKMGGITVAFGLWCLASSIMFWVVEFDDRKY